MKYLSVLLMVLTSISAFGGDAVYLPKGTAAPFEGYLITPDTATDIRNKDIDLSIKTRMVNGLQDENSVLTQRLVNDKSSIDSLSKQLQDSRDPSFLSRAGYFILGAVITGGLAYGIYKTR